MKLVEKNKLMKEIRALRKAEENEDLYAEAYIDACSDVLDSVKQLPTIDIIRCQDCKYYIPSFLDGFKGDCPHRKGAVDKNGYCDCGERSER